MASIKKLGEKWRAQVARKGVRKSAVWDTKREAIQWAERIEREIDAGLKHGRTFGAAVEHYLETVSIEKADVEWERRRFRDFQVFFAPDTPLSEITTLEMGKWRDWRLKGDPAKKRPPVAGATVLREINLMRHLFSLARDEWKWIPASPFTGLRMPEDSDPRHQLWRWQQIKRVLRADRTGKTADVIRAFRIALATSLRLKEVLEGRYDPAKRVMVLGGGNRTKGDGTKRVEVPIPRRAVKLLPDRFTVGANEASTLFCVLCDQLMIDDLTFHDSRATALTLLARRMDVMTLARISRHKDISLLFNTYYRESAEDISKRI
jgi:integrase